MIATALLVLATSAAALDFKAQTLDGRTATGPIIELSAGQVVLETPQGPAKFPLDALAVLTAKTPPEARKGSVWVELVDQTALAGSQFTVEGTKASLTLTGGAAIEILTRSIRWVRFGDRDEKLAKQWSEIVESKAAGDLLVVRKEGALDYLEGIVGDLDDKTCQFELDKENIPVKRAKVEGIVYFHAKAAELPESVGQLQLRDGSKLALARVELAGETVKVATPAGIELSWPLADVRRFDFSSGKIAYLSDLDPESSAYVPLVGFKDPPALLEFFQYRRDVGFEKNPLRLDGKVYRKGLSLQSRTTLVYKLPGKFRTFKTVLGIDDAVRETGDAKVEIKGDGKSLWQGDVRGSQPAQELELEITGVKRLEIVVDYGGGQDVGDHVDLCEARVTK